MNWLARIVLLFIYIYTCTVSGFDNGPAVDTDHDSGDLTYVNTTRTPLLVNTVEIGLQIFCVTPSTANA